MAGGGNNNDPTTMPSLPVDEEGNLLSDLFNIPSIAPIDPPSIPTDPDPPPPPPNPGIDLGIEPQHIGQTPNIEWGGSIPNYAPPPPPPMVSSTPIATDALGSLPSISNIGTTSYTGIVNWNSIPGGFQPLPQTAGRGKKLYQLSQFHSGINQKSSPRDIADFECQEATNVTVSQVGRIKLLGDIKGTDNSITTHDVVTTDRGSAGYGLFQFTAPVDAVGTVGEHVITLSADGDRIDAHDTTSSTTAAFIDYNSADRADVASVIYAAGSGVYACDANFSNANTRKANIYVSREDYNGAITTKNWSDTGAPLITSPTFIFSTAGAIDNAAAGKVTLEWDDESAPELSSGTDGAACVHIGSVGTGAWSGDYFIYISWLFDGGMETGLTALQKTGVGAPNGPYTFLDQTLSFNFSIKNNDNDASPPLSSTNYMGGDIRINGARVYYKKSGETERFLLAEISLIDGVKGSLDSTFTPWDENSEAYDLSTNIIFENPPDIHTYLSLNQYYANEVYDESKDTLADDTAGPAAHDVRYKTAVVGQQGVVFIGNVKFRGEHKPDLMMFSMLGLPGVFPKFNSFDSPSSDGSPITALAAFQDTILQFKENAMYVINVSNSPFYAEAIFRDCGISNPCQVFTTAFGVIFANRNGCFIYDGQKVISLTNGRFNFDDWDLPSDESSGIANDGAGVPCVGYDPRSQNIIVLKDINDDSTDTGAWVYNLVTRSWTEGTEVITNANGNKHTNFIITSGGYLSILRDDEVAIQNYKQTNNAQKLIYQTKDLDFGLPSQTKKLFKVYVTFKGNPANVNVSYGIDGAALIDGSSTGSELTDLPYEFTASGWSNSSTLSVATFTPDTSSEAKDWKSISLRFSTGTATVATSLEINDISILYRVRPIK